MSRTVGAHLRKKAATGRGEQAVDLPVTMRICGPADERALRLLAELDSARPLEGTILAAETEKGPLAAICLETRRVVADPFSYTADLVDLLRARATQLEGSSEPRPRLGSRGLHLARAWLSGAG